MLIYQMGEQLLAAEQIRGRSIRLIGIGGSNLVAPSEMQPDLFDQTTQKRTQLAKAVDELRGKLGARAIQRGASLQ
jgi:hypothetical protein